MTQKEWDKCWQGYYSDHYSTFFDPLKAFQYAHTSMMRVYGPRPSGEAGPPLWTKFAALVGVSMFQKIWDWLNGKKTIIGLVITILATIAGYLPIVLPVLGVDAVLVAKIVGIATTILGLLHKLYKWAFGEEHP